MVTLATNFNWGTALENENALLTRQLSEAYDKTARIVNIKIATYLTIVDPPNSSTPMQVNKNFELGDIWINQASNNAWIMTSRTTDLIVTWKQIT